jgi:hypothetical protein
MGFHCNFSLKVPTSVEIPISLLFNFLSNLVTIFIGLFINALTSAKAFHWVTLFYHAAENVCIHIREKGLTIISSSNLPDSFITEVVLQVIHEHSLESARYGFEGAWPLENGKFMFSNIYYILT